MKYDFVEVGTADFSALIETADEHAVGISIEPIRAYLDRLPSPPGVRKLCVAVSRTRNRGETQVHYIPRETIEQHNLDLWLAGCNSVGDLHRAHKLLNLHEHVVSETVAELPLPEIMLMNDVTELDLLKVDAEGGDSDILLTYLDWYLEYRNVPLPRRIVFETNILTPHNTVQRVMSRYTQELGYRVTRHAYGHMEEETEMTLE